jgi:hypothetical protein
VNNTSVGVLSGSVLVIDSGLGGRYELTLAGNRLCGVYMRGATDKVAVTFNKS